jgi:hypothetical protein
MPAGMAGASFSRRSMLSISLLSFSSRDGGAIPSQPERC